MKRSVLLLIGLIQFVITNGQNALPIVRANSKISSLREGNVYKKDFWTITPEARPDVWTIEVSKSSTVRVALITDVDSIIFNVELGKTYDFVVLLNGKDSAFTQIKGVPTPATFTEEYKLKMNNQTTAEIPEMYELIHIVLALTDFEIKDSDQVVHTTPYYTDLRTWFDPYKNEFIVLTFDSLLKKQFWSYFYLKMDAYSFIFEKNHIVQSPVYDRTSWGGENVLLPYIKALEEFAVKSSFDKFYRQHMNLYSDQISYTKDSLNTDGMRDWLSKNFPGTSYNSLKVIFSPLVGGSQCENTIINNGFKEVHAHVNFPYSYPQLEKYLSSTQNIIRGNVLFTEYNHAFINPEADKYSNDPKLLKAFADLSQWEQPNSGASAGYTNVMTCFEEYLNWGLVNLRYVDLLTIEEQNKLIPGIDRMMKEGRGFTKFPEFSTMLVDLYRNRGKDQTVADLYPAIIDWCSKQVK